MGTLTFKNRHDLLIYLVTVVDSDDGWRLRNGQSLSEKLRDEGLLDPSQPDREYAELGKLLWALKQDDSITLIDHAANQGPNPQPRQPWASFTMNDVFQFADIDVTGHGRLVAQTARPTIAINIENLDIVVLFEKMEQDIDRMEIDPEVKAEAKSKLRIAREALTDVGKTAVSETLSAALRHSVGLP